MDVARRLKFGLAALVALAASAFFAAPALADTQPDPQLSNVPYLAWRGEEVRLVKCEPDILGGLTAEQRAAVQQGVAAQGPSFLFSFVDFLLVDWSGDPSLTRPQLEPGTVSMFFRSFDGAPCVAGTFVSQKAGLAQIKLVVTFNISQGIGAPDGPELVTLKHDFNVGWMNIQSSTLTSLDPTTEVAGNPTGNQLQVLVNGTIPLLQDYGELGLGDQLVMPDDWARLANAIATFRDPLNPNPAQMWDIHDEFSPTSSPTDPADLHGAQSSCVHTTTAFFDTVDNCVPTVAPPPYGPVFDLYEIGAFSRVWQGFTNPTVGPFDPQRPQETLLSNGVLDKGDAPMPSALINFIIAPNSGAAGDISGVGSFCVVGDGIPTPPGQCRAVDKHIVYSRDGLGSTPPSPAAPHNLYAPFYATWIPATGPFLFDSQFGFGINHPEASGVNGPVNVSRVDCGRGNNFPGFQAGADCFYHYWDVAQVLACGPGGTVDPSDPIFGENGFCVDNLVPSGCLPLVAGGTAPGFGGAFIPGLAQHIDVYTDEHGEARVRFVPGTEFFFTSLPGVSVNSNGGCDIARIPGGVLGTASITAVAKYPFEPVTARPVASQPVVKTVTSLFEKSITCYPKGTQPDEQNAAICVARALDITGAPFVGETVCFFADQNAEDIQHFFGTITTAGNLVIPDTGRNAAAEAAGLRRICPYTDATGRAAVEIFNTNPTTVDLSALFVDEGILRHILVQFPITGQVGPATGVAAQQQPAATATATPTPAVTATPAATPAPSSNPAPAAVYKLKTAKLVRQSRTRASLLVRVNGPQGRASVRIRITGKGRTVALTRSVQTNKLVRVRNLRTPNAKTLRVSVSLVS